MGESRLAGTGGTIAGTGAYLKTMKPEVSVVLADPQGSGLYNKVFALQCVDKGVSG